MPFVSKWLTTSTLLIALAIIMGAFGAHGLKNRLDEYSLGVYEKAAFYHMTQAFGLLAVCILAKVEIINPSSAMKTNIMLLAGIIIFSGSLYTLAITGIKWLGAITPIGGSLLIAAWGYLAFSIYKNS